MEVSDGVDVEKLVVKRGALVAFPALDARNSDLNLLGRTVHFVSEALFCLLDVPRLVYLQGYFADDLILVKYEYYSSFFGLHSGCRFPHPDS